MLITVLKLVSPAQFACSIASFYLFSFWCTCNVFKLGCIRASCGPNIISGNAVDGKGLYYTPSSMNNTTYLH